MFTKSRRRPRLDLVRLAVLFSLLSSVSLVQAADKSEGEASEIAAAAAIGTSAVGLEPASAEATRAKPATPKERWISYSRKGLALKSKDGNFKGQLNIRSQLRFSDPFDAAPRSIPGFDKEEQQNFGFRRARFKAKGNIFRPWLKFSYEHDLVNSRLLTGDITIAKVEWLQFKVGQWKANFSRERVDSSGKQQFAERTIVNRVFTIDRQKGAMLTGRLMKGTRFDSRYYAGMFAGTGRGISSLDESDGQPMMLARYQWNFLGRDMEFSQSDLEYHEKPTASLSFATVSNRSRYTRFSGSGGGQLNGFEKGELGQYSVRQYMEETALKYRGFSFQHELHWKRIIDNKNLTTTHMRGSYFEGGYFFHYLYPKIPRQLELAGRYAFVDHNTAKPDDLLHELGMAANWFFDGHANKLTLEVSRLRLVVAGADPSAVRVRVQWDVSF